jgi:hypothetical protein
VIHPFSLCLKCSHSYSNGNIYLNIQYILFLKNIIVIVLFSRSGAEGTVPKYTYKHADIRPWDVRNDLVQYEKDYVICTKTRHVISHDSDRRHLPPPSFAATVFCRRRHLPPPLFATAVICRRRHLLPALFAAAVICHRRHLPPPSFAAAAPHFTDCQSA